MSDVSRFALSGRRVLEFADDSGAYCGKLLADMGADVIKVEPPTGDPGRQIPPFLSGTQGPDRGFNFLYMNTSKRAITLDLEAEEGPALARSLALTADIVLETQPPGRFDALGLGFDEGRSTATCARNAPDNSLGATGYARSGPRARSSPESASNLMPGPLRLQEATG